MQKGSFCSRFGRSALKIVFLCLISSSLWGATTGKIAGRVTDAATGGPLAGINVMVLETILGAATDADGYYTILNVPPGTYSLQSSAIGYARSTMENVRVNIDLTTTIDFQLQTEAVVGEEVVVVATAPIVQPDISSNIANVSAAEIENVSVAGVSEFIDLQAGIEPGLQIRGSGLDEVAFVLDGVTMRQGRTNQAFTDISYTSIKEFQIQTGGFNAEYGNVRSGIVNIVTKEGSPERYSADVILRYTPAQKMHFGVAADDPSSYFMRPYLDPDVAEVGATEGGWDLYTQRQYPIWEGWDKNIKDWADDDDLTNDLNYDQMMDLFWWYKRKDISVEQPNYELDGSLSGPVPIAGKFLGNLRFIASYREKQRAYFIPGNRDSYNDYTYSIKFTSDIRHNMKLSLLGTRTLIKGLDYNFSGFTDILTDANDWARVLRNRAISVTSRIWGNDFYNRADQIHTTMGLRFTHTLSPRTFQQVSIQQMVSDYRTFYPWNDSTCALFKYRRDQDSVAVIIGDSYEVNAAPFGYSPINIISASGMYLGGHWSKGHDSTFVTVIDARYDITNQVTHSVQLKAGAQYIGSDYNVDHRLIQEYFKGDIAPEYIWNRKTTQGAAYAQTKIEFEGLIANLGVRADYFDPGGTWYTYGAFSPAFSAMIGKDSIDNYLEMEATKKQLELSPRLGVSFPITVNSKIFFNYGHFRQVLEPENLFLLREIVTGAIDQIGNPDHPMPLTIAYELGYEHNLFDIFLLRLTGYYKALENQSRWVQYTNLDETTDYQRREPLNYGDIRGIEVTLNKNVGRYFRGFINYTYMAEKSGDFGFNEVWENPVEQREFERLTRDHYQSMPIATPFARFNLEFLLPPSFGPRIVGLNPLGDWRLSFLGTWRAGGRFTWSGEAEIPGLRDNVQWRSNSNFDLRFSKNIGMGGSRVQVYVDIDNVFNLKNLEHLGAFYSDAGWAEDRDEYMYSLHLPEDAFQDFDAPYLYVPGDDQPGDYRKAGVEFQPIETVYKVEGMTSPHTRPFYYELDNDRYMQYVDDTWVEVDQAKVDQVLDDKAYIDMPNLDFLRFLNPRTIRIGLRVSF